MLFWFLFSGSWKEAENIARKFAGHFFPSSFLLFLPCIFSPSIFSQTGQKQNVERRAFQLSLLQRFLAGEKVHNERGHTVLSKVLWQLVRKLLWRLLAPNWLQLQGKNLGMFSIPATCKAYCITFLCLFCLCTHHTWTPNNFKLLIYRTCPTRIVIGMTSVSNVPSAVAHWWKKHLQPRMIYCCAPNATPMIIPQNATTARKPSCQVCLRTIKSYPLRKFSNSSSQGEWQGGLQQTDGLKPS